MIHARNCAHKQGKIGSEISDKRIVHGGVPQGSKIGPVVFIVHINDLPLVLKQPEITYSVDMTKCENDDDDVTIFMDDTAVSEIIDIKNHIAGEAIGNAEKKGSHEIYESSENGTQPKEMQRYVD